MPGREARGGRRVAVRPLETGYQPDIAVLHRVKSRVDQDKIRDPAVLMKISKALATAIGLFDDLETASIAERRREQSAG